MAFLDNVKPIVRGRCEACGHLRNLWAKEMAEERLPCEHHAGGCPGEYRVVWTGPKGMLPVELRHAQCSCPSGSAAAGGGDVLAQLLDMGFSQAQASAAASRFGSDTAGAVEWLMSAGDAAAPSGTAATACGASSSGSVAARDWQPPADLGECPICCEDLGFRV